jgi:hypothetical protein
LNGGYYEGTHAMPRTIVKRSDPSWMYLLQTRDMNVAAIRNAQQGYPMKKDRAATGLWTKTVHRGLEQEHSFKERDVMLKMIPEIRT